MKTLFLILAVALSGSAQSGPQINGNSKQAGIDAVKQVHQTILRREVEAADLVIVGKVIGQRHGAKSTSGQTWTELQVEVTQIVNKAKKSKRTDGVNEHDFIVVRFPDGPYFFATLLNLNKHKETRVFILTNDVFSPGQAGAGSNGFLINTPDAVQFLDQLGLVKSFLR